MRRRTLLRALVAGLLGAAVALLVGCGSSGGGLIPASQGGPLQSDIEAVERAAEAGNGECAQTEAALLKTEQDFAALPSSIDSGLHDKLKIGVENLRKVAIEACQQPQATTKTDQAPRTTSTPTTPTTTTPSTSTTTTTTTPPPVEHEEEPGPGGGTPAPGEGNGKGPGEGVGGASPEEGGNGAGGAGGAEGGK